jgi:hypothetical protein
MTARKLWSSLAVITMIAAPALFLGHHQAVAAAANSRAEWRAPKAKKTTTKATKAPAATPSLTAPAAGPTATPNPSTPLETSPNIAPQVVDQSQEVLDIDFAMAAAVAASGPRLGYMGAMSEEGVLYDANGASPLGAEAANSRFTTFPADVTFVRTPEKALAAGGSGSSWGTYTIKRGDTILSSGRYISVWRREAVGWKMVSELAAGKAPTAPATQSNIGILPKRPASLGRAPASPIGVPLTVPTPPAAAATSETPPAQP